MRKRLTRTLLIAAMLVQALLPSGFMPAFGGEGTITLVICSGMDVKTVHIDRNGQTPQQDQNSHDTYCPFSPVNTATGDIDRKSAMHDCPAGLSYKGFADTHAACDSVAAANTPRAPPVLI